jgi:hypothetical protein
MSFDLTVDELKAAPRIYDLFAKAGGQLSEQIAVFEGSSFGIQVQLAGLA